MPHLLSARIVAPGACSLRKKTVGKRKPGVVLKSLRKEDTALAKLLARLDASPTSTGSKLASEELGFALSFHLVSLAAEPPSVDLEFCASLYLAFPPYLDKYVKGNGRRAEMGFSQAAIVGHVNALSKTTYPVDMKSHKGYYREQACSVLTQKVVAIVEDHPEILSEPSVEHIELMSALVLSLHDHPCYRQVVRAIHAQSVLLLADPTLPDEQREFISEFARGNIMYDAHQSANRGAAAALTPFEQKTYGHTTLAYKLMVQKTHGWVEQNYLAEQVELENVSEVVGVAVLSRTGTLGVVGGLDGLDFDSVQQDFHFDFSAVDILSHYYFHTLSSFLDSSNPSSFRVPPDALSAMQELHAGASVLPFLLNLHLAAAARRLWTLAGPEGDPRWTRLKVVTEARFTRAFGEFLVFLETPMYQASATGVHTLGLLLENLKALPGWIDVLVDAVLSQSSDFSPEQAERVRHLLAVAGDAFYTVGQWEKELRTKLEAVEVTSQIVELALEDIDRI